MAARRRSGRRVGAVVLAVVQDQARAQFAASIPGATTQLAPDAHHYIHVERPDVVIKAVQAVAGKVP